MIPSWAHGVKPEKIMRQICKICLSDGRISTRLPEAVRRWRQQSGKDMLGKAGHCPLRQRTSDLDEKTCR